MSDGEEAERKAADAETNVRAKGGRKVVFVLINAALETVKTKKGYELLCADTHGGLLRKHNKDPMDYRPDIVHSSLLTLLDSPLNKAGLQKIYLRTLKNELIEVSPRLRIPRTFKRFAGLMVQLLHRQKIRASGGSDVLLKMVKNNVLDHLPAGCTKLGTSVNGELVNMNEFAASLPDDEPVVFVVGQQSHGDALVDWTERLLSVSQYPLSAAVALGRICNSFESAWGIL